MQRNYLNRLNTLNEVLSRSLKENLPKETPFSHPIHLSVNYQAESLDHLETLMADPDSGYIYSRFRHPSASQLEPVLAEIQQMEASLLMPSGSAAITAALIHLLKKGDTVACLKEAKYFRLILNEVFHELDLHIIYLTARDLQNSPEKLLELKPNLVCFDTISNPLCELIDLRQVKPALNKIGAVLVADNTLAGLHHFDSTYFDVCIHSFGKTANGHGDGLSGAVIGSNAVIGRIRKLATRMGFYTDPFTIFLLERSLRTYSIRIEKQMRSTHQIAQFLRREKSVRQVIFLSSHDEFKEHPPGCPIITFELKTEDDLKAFIAKLKRLKISGSFGGFQSTVCPVKYLFTQGLNSTDMQTIGLNTNMVRIAVGLEDPEFIVEDLSQALRA